MVGGWWWWVTKLRFENRVLALVVSLGGAGIIAAWVSKSITSFFLVPWLPANKHKQQARLLAPLLDESVSGSEHGCHFLAVQFIFISPDEMQAVADFIRQRGRIAIAELAQRSNTFIDLAGRQVEGLEAAELELPPEVAAA